MSRNLTLLVLAACLTGCMRTAVYQRPATPVPNSFPTNDPASTPEAAAVQWRDYYADPKLQSVIELALTNNRDLRLAALNVERVQALYRIQRAQQFPTIAANAAGNMYRLPSTTRFGAFTVSESVTFAQFNLNLGAVSWELDLFGRIRSLKTAALEQYLATTQAQSAAQIALIGAVAQSYLALAADHDSLQLARQTLATQQDTHNLILRTRQAGLASDLEVRQAESQVEAARGDIARYTALIALGENALNLLAGVTVPAESLPARLDAVAPMPDIQAGMSSSVLLRRPDILMAEHTLKAAYANIGAARAAYFPRIALTGGGGFMSSSLTTLIQGGARSWNFAPQVALPIFDSGARKAGVKVAETGRDAAIAEYEKAIQSAFREVSDCLALRARLVEQEQAQQALVRSLAEAHRLAGARFQAGIDSYLGVLVAQRSLYAAQQGLVSIQAARLANLVALYKVLGGGA